MTNERPIIFNTEAVQAILRGEKTQTRRVVKPQPPEDTGVIGPEWYYPTRVKPSGEEYPGPKAWGIYTDDGEWATKCPYLPGQVLWVRETWAPCATINSWLDNENKYIYKADFRKEKVGWKWRPSIHMPRAAARLFLRVKNVRVERLQEILCGDMRREGCIPSTVKGGQYQQWQRDYWIPLWDSLNAKRGYGWDVNPWVWVVEFEQKGGRRDGETAKKNR